MTQQEFARKIKQKTNNELYLMARRYLLQENLGLYHNRWKCDLLYDECSRRGEEIFMKAFSDASYATESLKLHIETGAKAMIINRIDFMNKPELRTYLQSAVDSKTHPTLVDSAKIEDLFKNIESSLGELNICSVIGNSMKNARILDGDLLIIDRNDEPKNGSIAVVTIADNMLVKRLLYDDNRLYLVSENEKLPPYEVHESDDFTILGIVKMVLLRVDDLKNIL